MPAFPGNSPAGGGREQGCRGRLVRNPPGVAVPVLRVDHRGHGHRGDRPAPPQEWGALRRRLHEYVKWLAVSVPNVRARGGARTRWGDPAGTLGKPDNYYWVIDLFWVLRVKSRDTIVHSLVDPGGLKR